jgi:hypothetical protein
MSKWVMRAIYISIAFQWYKEVLNPFGFDPCNHSQNIQKSTRTITLKMKFPLGVWGFIPSHFLSLLGFLFWPATLHALALVVSPRLRLWQSPCYVHNSNEMTMKSPCWEALRKYSRGWAWVGSLNKCEKIIWIIGRRL